ncbi:hypothetical protein M407DRAFT_29474 [Tulasnella calospora MUT 4182]|uniref:Ubiquitin-like protease family profile domain-containing protein n=1 Tax=Tulasnella calospora MUT 4182 TaxID=1051891 RepID=A0A0C3QA39_9AGAM|nr:hypothetical protein M407DRAFT_29474 [Tulasnella calospora MUT 4182]
METTPPRSDLANRSLKEQNSALAYALEPWICSSKRSWELTSALTNIRISIDPRTMRELKMGVKWSGETVTAVLDVWHSQFVTFNPGVAPRIRIGNTYAFSEMVKAFGMEPDSDEHKEAIKVAATYFRFNARREPAKRITDILEHEYLVIPLHVLGDHWSLAIVADPFNLLPSNRVNGTRPTYIYTLDSLQNNGASQNRARRAIRSWLTFAVKYFLDVQIRGKDIKEFPIEDTAVQPNGVDCGPYVHHHLDTFFQTGNPQKIREHFTSGASTMIDEDLVNMWRYPTALQCRYTVAQMLLCLQRNPSIATWVFWRNGTGHVLRLTMGPEEAAEGDAGNASRGLVRRVVRSIVPASTSGTP